jgi:uncharacterized membrane protein YfcA
MAFDVSILIVLGAAFGAGLVDAMVGGGGLIQLPALFGAFPDAPPAQLLGTNKLSGLFGTASAVTRFARQIAIPWRALWPLSLLAFAGALGGALTATHMPASIFRPLVPALLVAVLIYSLRAKSLGKEHRPVAFAGRHHYWGAAWIAGIGFYDGFFGPGTGSFLMFVFVRLYGFDFLNAAAAARVLNVATNAAALAWFGSNGTVFWTLGAGMAVCNVLGALFGARLALRGGSHFVRKVFVAVVSVLIVRTAWTAFGPS